MDAAADAALFVKVDILDLLAEAAVAGEKIVKEACSGRISDAWAIVAA